FAAAKDGALGTPEQIGAQAERLLKDDRAKDGLRDFHMQWLGLYGVDELEKDPVFATYSPDVAKAMLTETASLIDATLFGPRTTGKLYEDFTKAGACQTCHVGINGAGFAFENYDAAGGYRAMEEGQPVDASGALDLPSGKLAFKDGVDLSHKLATTAELRECVA